MDQEPETQPIESLSLNEWEIKFFPFSHRNIHRRFEGADRYYKYKDVCGNHVSILTPENRSRMVVTGAFTQWQTSWPTSMAVLAAIQARLALEW